MDYRRFGGAGLFVSPLGLGTANFSFVTDEAESLAILEKAFDVGVNLVDTSDNYNAGRSEEVIGRWFAQGGGRREKTVLATKVFSAPTDFGSADIALRTGSWVGPNQRGLSAKHIREACEASLKRLGTDYIDVYQMHHIDRGVRWEEVWQAMELLVQQGKVLYVGSSNFAGWHIAQAQETARRRDFLGLVSEQSVYSLARRSIELEVIPACRAYGMAVLPYSPLGGGRLAGKASDDGGRRRAMKPSQTVELYEVLCNELGHAPALVALAWVCQQPGVTAPILGPRTLAQFESSLAALELALPQDVLARLDQLFPGPGGPAPEAYAW